jgi:hypothetical protein
LRQIVVRACAETARRLDYIQYGRWDHPPTVSFDRLSAILASAFTIGATSMSVRIVTGELARLQIQPGDTLVLTVPAPLTEAQKIELQRAIEWRFPNVPSMILSHGMTLSIAHNQTE